MGGYWSQPASRTIDVGTQHNGNTDSTEHGVESGVHANDADKARILELEEEVKRLTAELAVYDTTAGFIAAWNRITAKKPAASEPATDEPASSVPFEEPLPICDASVHRLPDELLLDIFGSLAQPDTLSVAGTCRRWREIARGLPNFYAHLKLKTVDLPRSDQYNTASSVFLSAIDAATAAGLKLSLDIDITQDDKQAYDHSDSDPEFDENGEEVNVFDLKVMKLSSSPPLCAFPQYLLSTIRLNLCVSVDFYDAMYDALKSEAPVLESFRLSVKTGWEEYRGVEPDLFGKSAPQLRKVDLDILLNGTDVIPAFKDVREVSIFDHQATSLDSITLIFPAVELLTFSQLDCWDVGLVRCPSLYCPKLSRLVVETSHAPSAEALAHVLLSQPVQDVHLRFQNREYTPKIAPFAVHLIGPIHISMAVYPSESAHPDWNYKDIYVELHSPADGRRLSVRTAGFEGFPASLSQLGSLFDRLTELHIILSELLYSAVSALNSLPQLTTLSIGMNTEDTPALSGTCACPVLETIHVHANVRYSRQMLCAVLRYFDCPSKPLLVAHGSADFDVGDSASVLALVSEIELDTSEGSGSYKIGCCLADS